MDELIERYAKRVRMDQFLDHEPTKLSGGQKQRVAIAGILAMSPSIIILDESTSMLDPRGRKEINELIRELKEDKEMTIISITHDIEEAKNADRILLLNKGEIVGDDQPETLLMNEKLLLDLHLDTPFALKVSRKLKAQGIQINETLNVEELEKQLCQLHAKI
jgi:energy-coupling factor transport system ATP-binding protein